MICNLGVVGSNPTRGSNCFHVLLIKIKDSNLYFLGQLPEWTNGADCNSAGYAYGGSNPSLPTIFNPNMHNKYYLVEH